MEAHGARIDGARSRVKSFRLRRRRLLGASAAAGLALSGCRTANRQPSVANPSTTNLDDNSLTPQRGGQFQMTGYRPLESLNPWTVAGGNDTFYFTGGVYEALLNYDYRAWQDWRERKLVPSLAERWEQPDPTTYTFHLRQNVRWHDGQPFTGEDVRWAIEFLADPANKLKTGTFFRNMASLSLLDASTVQIKTKIPDVTFLGGLQGETEILPKHVHDRGDQFEKVSVGTGAFKIASYDPEQGWGTSRTGTTGSQACRFWTAGRIWRPPTRPDGWRRSPRPKTTCCT